MIGSTRRAQFGRSIAKNQMIQSVLVQMLGEVTAMQLYCIRLGRLIDDGKMSDTMASLAKYVCSVKARHVCRLARDVLGGNGILLDFHLPAQGLPPMWLTKSSTVTPCCEPHWSI